MNKDTVLTYCDSVQIVLPDSSSEKTNKIFFQFRNSPIPDSLYLTITKAQGKNIYWHQIFYSSVQISELNEFIIDTGDFRIKASNLVARNLLTDNDTLINQCIKYFNNDIDKSKIADCGTNTEIFKSICDKFSLPCRKITLMGGDANELGYGNTLGYPSHSVCEVYSSKFKKWYVLDPTYGFKFRKNEIPLNALQISDAVFFNEVSNIIQDSIFFTNRSLVGRDYFKYYENVYYPSDININIFLRQVLRRFFSNFSYLSYHYTNALNFRKNGRVYLGAKAFIYIIFILLYIITIILLLGIRLYKEKANSGKTIKNE